MQLNPHHINQINLIPLKLVAAFEKTLNIKDILFTLHQIIKHSFEYKSNIGFNLDAYLTLDKSRKVAQLKEDVFIKEVSEKINDYHSFLTLKSDSSSIAPKLTITEVARFTQLFYERKSQLAYLQRIVQKTCSSLEYNEKQVSKNSNSLQKMKNILHELQQKLIIVINKMQEHISVGENSHLKLNKKQTPKLNAKPSRRPSSANKTKIVILKVENSAQISDKQKVENQQIQRLKSEYRRLNCKKQNQKVDQIHRKAKRQASVIKFCTEPDNVEQGIAKVNTEHKNQGSQIEQVFNPTFQKQIITKYNTFFSKFVKSTKSNSMLNLESDQILKIYAKKKKKLQIKGEKKKINTLTKKPSAQSLFDNLSKSNPAHSFYVSRLAHEDRKQKKLQNRASTAKLARHSMKILQDKQQKCKQLSKRFSRRQSQDFTIKKHLLQQALTIEDISCSDGANILSTQFKLKTMQKITPNLQIKEEQYEQKEQDEMVELKQISNKQKALRKKSRIIRFSKTNIGSGDDTDGEQAEKAKSTNKKLNIWDYIKDQQLQLQEHQNQVTTISLSPSKSQLIKRRGTNENLSTSKLIYKSNKQFFQQLGANDDTNDPQGRKISFSNKKYGKVRKYLRGHENTVNLSQCKQLYEQITQQWKQDKDYLFGRGFQIMMRKKYDKNYKPQNNYDKKEEFEFGESRIVRRKATDSKVTQSETTVDSYRRQMWGHEDLEQAGLNDAMTRKLGELGQKSMEDNKDKSQNKWDQQQELETLYI